MKNDNRIANFAFRPKTQAILIGLALISIPLPPLAIAFLVFAFLER